MRIGPVRTEFRPVTLRQARDFVGEHHRHHYAPQGGQFAVALMRGPDLVGVAIAGRPVARGLDDGLTLEVTRLCVVAGVPNGCSRLYSRMRRIGQAMGYQRIITYTLSTEPGTSLRAAGWTEDGRTTGGSWNSPARKRADDHPIQQKIRWLAPEVNRPKR